jgi:hypothetical protein
MFLPASIHRSQYTAGATFCFVVVVVVVVGGVVVVATFLIKLGNISADS